MVLEGPYYGARRPPAQSNSKLLHVSDLIKLGSATVAESLSLLALLRTAGVRELGVAGAEPSALLSLRVSRLAHSPALTPAGWSMGGVHACMVNALHPGPLACVAMVTPRSAADAYCEGALAPFTSLASLGASTDELGVVRV